MPTRETADRASRILLIEDSPSAVSMMQNAVAEHDSSLFEIESQGTLEAGLKRLRMGGIDLVLLDLSLPDSAGLATFERIHSEAPDVPIVVLTGNDDETAAMNAVRLGARDYLVKGRVSNIALVRVLRYAIERKRNERERLRREKLEGVLEMAGATCHELNQPLQVISGHSELLLMQMPEDGPLYKRLRAIKRQVDRMAEITRKLNCMTRYKTRDYVEGVKIVDMDNASNIPQKEWPGLGGPSLS